MPPVVELTLGLIDDANPVTPALRSCVPRIYVQRIVRMSLGTIVRRESECVPLHTLHESVFGVPLAPNPDQFA